MKKITVLLSIMLVCGASLQAQVVDSAQLLIKYVPKLANSNKINQQAVLKDTVVSDPIEFNYVIAPTKPALEFAAGDMQVGKLNPEVKERYYRNYIKLGFGYPITPLAELSMHNCQNPKYSYGLNFHHFSSWAPPIGKEQKKYAYAPTSDTRVHLSSTVFSRTIRFILPSTTTTSWPIFMAIPPIGCVPNFITIRNITIAKNIGTASRTISTMCAPRSVSVPITRLTTRTIILRRMCGLTTTSSIPAGKIWNIL